MTALSPDSCADPALLPALAAKLRDAGHAFVPAADMRAALETCGALGDWADFAASWDQLPLDEYMADHGRYRRRRHAVYGSERGSPIVRQPGRPHFQGVDYNPLNGGIERWFEPVDQSLGDGSSMRTILAFCRGFFESLAHGEARWDIEVHQFRIEAVSGESALPTPEGMHRDGVDYVLVLLIRRQNIDSGTTMIGAGSGGFTSSFTLTDPFDAALVDDRRVYHGVTPVQPLDPRARACRDVLVVTFRKV